MLGPRDARGGARPRRPTRLNAGFWNFKRRLRGDGEVWRGETYTTVITSPSSIGGGSVDLRSVHAARLPYETHPMGTVAGGLGHGTPELRASHA